ncbi:hypothetical protein AB0T83_01915 [Fluviibacterium sp. DFM31]|uniref:DUF1127 domain-containing protein n=1 Tax=Meridianimarinicoccus marinus TaxID=3231483 RepID=A0ABV3L1X9_9RHOB
MHEAKTDDATEIIFMPPIAPALDRTLCDLGFGLNPASLRRAILPEVLRLNAKSDAELSLIGIRRAQIPAFVLRHRFPHMDPRAA